MKKVSFTLQLIGAIGLFVDLYNLFYEVPWLSSLSNSKTEKDIVFVLILTGSLFLVSVGFLIDEILDKAKTTIAKAKRASSIFILILASLLSLTCTLLLTSQLN